ncbi:hypothetical protein E2C01_028188 [Portunus trituberculatus]|uniref:Uncharacterized protein n=1 Tax=Portunus trituberculatus TaxID=210409 RepID=A0A5B7EN83_PORTR|nr:hypothetical protein [Portunus trituberculatus]
MSRLHQANDLAHTGLLCLGPQPRAFPSCLFFHIYKIPIYPFLLSFLPSRHPPLHGLPAVVEYEGRSQPKGLDCRGSYRFEEAFQHGSPFFLCGSCFRERRDGFISLVNSNVLLASSHMLDTCCTLASCLSLALLASTYVLL